MEVGFRGCLDTVVLQHQDHAQARQQNRGKATLATIPLKRHVDEDAESDATATDEANSRVALVGSADLTLLPGQTLVFNLDIPLREPGETVAESLTLNVESDMFNLQQSLSFQERNLNLWHISASATKHLAHPQPLAIRVLPRPPKMEVRCPVSKEQYYTDEPISLEFEIENGEDVEALARLDVVLFGEKPPSVTVVIPGQAEQTSASVRSEETRLSGAPMGTIPSFKSLNVGLRLPPIERSSRYDLTLKVTYFLPTNPGTPISQTATFQLNVVNPFEANYDLLPRVHPDPWPSVFDPDTVTIPATSDSDSDATPIPVKGVSQAWCLVTRYASFASEPLLVTDVDIAIQPSPTLRCSLTTKHTNLPPTGAGRIVHPKTIQEATFSLSIQKLTVDDRSHAPLDTALIIKWIRADDNTNTTTTPPNITTLPIPRFTLFGTEPRVLASVSHHNPNHNHHGDKSSSSSSPLSALPLIKLTITIENPSNHFLTFGLAMEPSESFAFSGPKQTTASLLPVSRRSVEYRLLPYEPPSRSHAAAITALTAGAAGEEGGEEEEKEEGEGWWIRPGLVVRDKYFQKVLRVVAGGEGVRGGKEGFEVWVPRGVGKGAGVV